jgi:hypothetical protein
VDDPLVIAALQIDRHDLQELPSAARAEDQGF